MASEAKKEPEKKKLPAPGKRLVPFEPALVPKYAPKAGEPDDPSLHAQLQTGGGHPQREASWEERFEEGDTSGKEGWKKRHGSLASGPEVPEGAVPGQPGSGDVIAQVGRSYDPALKAVGMGGPPAANDLEPAPGGGAKPTGMGGMGGGGPAAPTEGWKVPELVRHAFTAADSAHQKAIDDAERAGEDEAIVQKAHLFQIEREREAEAEEAKAKEIDRKSVLRSYQEQAETLADDAANTKIDSNRLWSKANVGQKVVGMLGFFLNGFMKGAFNRDVGGVDEVIQRDIEEQKANYAIKSDAAHRAQSIFGMAMQRFHNEDIAALATHNALLAKTEMELKRMALSAQTIDQKAKYDGMRAQLADRRAQVMGQFYGFLQQPGGGGGSHKLDADLKWIAEQEQKGDLPTTSAAAQDAMRIYSDPASATGTGLVATHLFSLSPVAYQAAYGEAAVAREQAWHDFRNRTMKALSGAGVTASEMERLDAQLNGAHDPASRRRAAAAVQDKVNAQRATIAAGAKPGAYQEFEARKGEAAGRQAPTGTAAPPAGFRAPSAAR